jgi:hypothetical protein
LTKKGIDLVIGDWGLGIGDWAQSPIPNPQSPIPNPKVCFIFKKLIKNNFSNKIYYILQILLNIYSILLNSFLIIKI